MNKPKWALSLGTVILALGLMSAVCDASPPAQYKAPDSASPGAYSAAALYNLGNAYAREGKLALAVLNYQRASVWAPRDPDIQANLSQVRKSASLPAEQNGFVEHFRALNPNASYWLGLSGLLTGGICGLLLAFKKYFRVALGAATAAGLLMVAYALCDAAATAHIMHEAVVMQSASASASPIVGADTLFTLNPATTVRIQDEHGNFYLIRDSHNNVGWVPRSQIAPVINSRGDFHA